MPYILVVSNDISCRRLYVDNLVRRGYLAVGVSSAIEAENLLKMGWPELVLACCMPATYEKDIERLRRIYDTNRPLVLITEEKPDPGWAATRNVIVYSSAMLDPRHLVETLRPWISNSHVA